MPCAVSVLSDEMYLPATSKWVMGTIRRRPVHCYLYSNGNAFVVISMDKNVRCGGGGGGGGGGGSREYSLLVYLALVDPRGWALPLILLMHF